ncbi:MAG: Tad domain-containing protein [Chloroflexota bacterium]
MNPVPAPRRSERGQVLVIVAGGLVVIVAMVGLVIDGGFAWSRQRDTQNGADAVAKAGTIVVQHYIGDLDTPTPNDFDVACAVAAAAAENGVAVEEAEYVDYAGESLLPNPVLVGDCASDLGVGIPAGAQGVKARASETFDTFLMAVIGVPTLTAVADAIAVVGTLETITGGALPVTFPQTSEICDSTETPFTVQADDGFAPWEPYEILSSEAAANSSNLAIVPLCDVAPGSVGWLDWDCGQRLALSITEPCPITIPIPAWVHTQTGNVNSLEAELNSYAGPAAEVGTPTNEDSVLALPIHDFTCSQDVPDNVEPEPDGVAPDPGCPSFEDWSGMGNNLYYHVPFWIGFKLDQAYTQGGDFECQTGPGSPVLVGPEPPGKVGCLKGWFVAYYPAPGSVGIGPINPGEVQNLAVTLIN